MVYKFKNNAFILICNETVDCIHDINYIAGNWKKKKVRCWEEEGKSQAQIRRTGSSGWGIRKSLVGHTVETWNNLMLWKGCFNFKVEKCQGYSNCKSDAEIEAELPNIFHLCFERNFSIAFVFHEL